MNFSRIYFRYDENEKAKQILNWTTNFFGPAGQRWDYESMDIIEGPNLWYIIFTFQDIKDQIIFNLVQNTSHEI